MWSLQIVNPLGKISLRKSLIFVATLLVTLFAYLAVMSSTAYAATPDATWKNGQIDYKGHTYTGPTQAKDGDGHDLPAGTILYSYLSPPVPFSSQTLSIIYFPAGSSATAADTGIFVTYTRGPTGGLSNKSSPTTVVFKDVTKPADPNAPANPTDTTPVSSCRIDGIGWIICPVTNFLSTGMDWVFKVLSGFIEVRPLSATMTNDNVMFNTWNVMRNFSNVVFVIVFIIIIYSQLTSAGLSNYGIKRMLPRLIIGAILVNVSYWICAIAIDVSNILGYSVQDLFLNLRDTILGAGGNGWQFISWQSVASFIMAGGAVGGAAALAFVSTSVSLGAFSVVGVMLLLLPVLAGALLTILVVLLILAARQAIITVFVIIAPLAFVAYLMPSTEKWFDKWRDVFMTMMVFFPAFSLVFGGAQFAGFAILHNAQDINTVILGLAVQVAPLAITPLLLKFSGSLLGRIAGIVNNKQKGFVDRARNFSKDRLDANRAQQMARTRQMAKDGTLRPRHAMRRTALLMDDQKRLRDGMKSINETSATALFGDSTEGRSLHKAEHLSSQTKEKLENNVKAHLQQEINVHGSELHLSNVQLEASKVKLEEHTGETTAILQEYKAGKIPNLTGALGAQADIIKTSTEAVALNSMRAESAKHSADESFTKDLEENTRQYNGMLWQTYAGGVQGLTGAKRALASSINSQAQAHQEAVKNATTILTHGNYGDDVIGEIAQGNSGTTGITVTSDIKEAAIMKIAGGANTVEILKLMQNLEINPSDDNRDFRQAYADTLISNPNKPKFAGAGIIANNKQGIAPPPGKARIDQYVAETANANKLGSAEVLVTHDRDYLTTILDSIQNNTSGVTLDPTSLSNIKEQLYIAATDQRYNTRIGERKNVLRDLYAQLPSGNHTLRNGNPLPTTILDD
jgi:hypothetical protein